MWRAEEKIMKAAVNAQVDRVSGENGNNFKNGISIYLFYTLNLI